MLERQEIPIEIIDLERTFSAARIASRWTGAASGIGLPQRYISLHEAADGVVVRQWLSSEPAQIDGWLDERLRELRASA